MPDAKKNNARKAQQRSARDDESALRADMLRMAQKEFDDDMRRYEDLARRLERRRATLLAAMYDAHVDVQVDVPVPSGGVEKLRLHLTRAAATGETFVYVEKKSLASVLDDPADQLACKTETITAKLGDVGTERMSRLYSRQLAKKHRLAYLTPTGAAYVLEEWRAERPRAEAALKHLRRIGVLPLDDAGARLPRKEHAYMRAVLGVFRSMGYELQVNPQRRFVMDAETVKARKAEAANARKERKADGWCDVLRMDWECDEKGHASYDKQRDSREKREADIRAALRTDDVAFAYFNPDSPNFSLNQLCKDVRARILDREKELAHEPRVALVLANRKADELDRVEITWANPEHGDLEEGEDEGWCDHASGETEWCQHASGETA